MTVSEMRQALCKPSWCSSHHQTIAILRLNSPFQFIEWPREEMKKVFDELELKLSLVESGIESFTASDRLLFYLLMVMAGDVKLDEEKA